MNAPIMDSRTQTLLEAPIVPTLTRLAAPNIFVMVERRRNASELFSEKKGGGPRRTARKAITSLILIYGGRILSC
jgi:hypothetical protein